MKQTRMAAPRSWLATRFTLAFGLLALALISLVGLAWQSYTELLAAQDFRARSDAVVATLNQLEAELQPDAQRALCAVTGGPPLAPSDTAPAAWPATLSRLQALLADEPRQAERAGLLRKEVAQWEQLYGVPLRQACAQGLRLGAAEVQSRARVALPVRTRIVEGLKDLQQAALAQRRERDKRLSERVDASRQSLALLSAAAVVLGAIAVVVVRSFTLRMAEGNRKLFGEAQRRALVQDRLTLSQRRMRVLLDHIPDAVIAFDARGRVQWINPIGEAMFGAPRRVLLGRSMALLMPDLDDELQWPNTEPQPMAGDDLPDDDDRPLPWTARHLQVDGLRARGGGAAAERFPVDVSLVQTRAEGHRVGVCVARDLSEVQRVERMKHEFVSMVSHELRTPLTSIHGSLSLLAESADELDPTMRRLVGLAHDNSERLVALVNDILDFEKLRAGQMRIDAVAIDLRDVAHTAVATCEGMAARRATRVVVRAGDTPLPLWTDPMRLNQVLVNLLSNAIKFSPVGGEVTLLLEPLDSAARAVVSDQGPGVPVAFVEHLFEPFAQAANLDTRKQGGTGLGLAISRALIERMGGQIGLEPPQPGRGAVFWIVLPMHSLAMGPLIGG
jgi:NtrC-family two-component system sensor histidine kinase KinB